MPSWRGVPPETTLNWVTTAVGGGRFLPVSLLRGGGWHANHALTVTDRSGGMHHLVLRRWARPGWTSAACLASPELVPEWYHRIMAMTVRTDPEMEKALTALAQSEGASRQEIIRRAVLDRYERHGHRAQVEASSDRMLKRWGDVLERLGRA